jgi:hypothetical protein
MNATDVRTGASPQLTASPAVTRPTAGCGCGWGDWDDPDTCGCGFPGESLRVIDRANRAAVGRLDAAGCLCGCG